MPIYMIISGMNGGVTINGVTNAFLIDAFNWGLTNDVTIGSSSGGAGAGKAKFSPLTVTKKLSAGSVSLLLAVAKGQDIQQLTILVARDDGAKQLEQIIFKTVFVQSYQQSDDAGSPIEETLVMQYVEFSVTNGMSKDGAPPEVGGWNQVLNNSY
jgi:type VI secretion system secreted protein Hcp